MGDATAEDVALGLVAWSLVSYLERCASADAKWCERVMESAGVACGSVERARSQWKMACRCDEDDEFVVVRSAERSLAELASSVTDRPNLRKLLRDIVVAEGSYEAPIIAVAKDASIAAGLNWMEVASLFPASNVTWWRDEGDDEQQSFSRVRWMKVSLAAAGGGLVLAASGGAAAPSLAASIAASVSLGAEGLATCITGVFGVLGASVSGIKATRRFTVDPHLRFEATRPSRGSGSPLFVLVPGWAQPDRSASDAWGRPCAHYDWWTERCGPGAGATAVRWAPDALSRLYDAMRDASLWIEARDRAARGLIDELLRRSALAACSLPLALLDLAASLDDPWAIAVARAETAGVALARKLLDSPKPRPPVTLVGYSLGSRLVVKCLDELADHPEGRNIVENVILLGAPIAARVSRFRKARSIVAGTIVNAYSTRDWMLKLAYRSKAWSIVGVAGAVPVPDAHLLPGFYNLDLSDLVNGHLVYPHVMPQIFAKLNLGVVSASLHPGATHIPPGDNECRPRIYDGEDDDDVVLP